MNVAALKAEKNYYLMYKTGFTNGDKLMLSKRVFNIIGILLMWGCTPRVPPNEPQTSPNQSSQPGDVQHDAYIGKEVSQTSSQIDVSPEIGEKTIESQLLLPPWLAPNWIPLVKSGLMNVKLTTSWEREDKIKKLRETLERRYDYDQNARCDPPGSELTNLSIELLSLSVESVDFYLTGLVWLHLAYVETECPVSEQPKWFATLAQQALLIALKRPPTKNQDLQEDIYKSLAEASCIIEDLETAWRALEELAKMGVLEPVWVASHIPLAYIRQQGEWIARLSVLFPKTKPHKPLMGAFSISFADQEYQDDDEIWGFCEKGQLKIIPRYGGDWQIVYYGQIKPQKDQILIELTLKCGMDESGFGDCCHIKENRKINSQILRLQTAWLSTLTKPKHSLYPCDPPENRTLHADCKDIR